MSKPTGDTRFHIGYGLAAIQIILTGIVIVMISNLKTYNPDTQVPTTSTSTSSVSLKTYKDLATDIKQAQKPKPRKKNKRLHNLKAKPRM